VKLPPADIYEQAIAEILKNLDKFINNHWVCAAFTLDPSNLQEGLEMAFVEHGTADVTADDVGN
jgi:hypothetical protein